MSTEQKERLIVAFRQLHKQMASTSKAAATVARRFRSMERQFARVDYTPGDRHIERVVREILARTPGRDPSLRLLVASDFAEVLDRGRNGPARRIARQEQGS